VGDFSRYKLGRGRQMKLNAIRKPNRPRVTQIFFLPFQLEEEGTVKNDVGNSFRISRILSNGEIAKEVARRAGKASLKLGSKWRLICETA
jgi:hypothetical protein